MKTKTTQNKVLENYLKSDIKLLGLPTDFNVEFRGYSKSYYGRYYIADKKIVVYILDESGHQIPYHEILDTLLHEAIHHYQHHHDKNFVRHKGVMHNLEFKRMYEQYKNELLQWEVIPSA